jgi:diguanylate cyclase (GGDEF)-like protein
MPAIHRATRAARFPAPSLRVRVGLAMVLAALVPSLLLTWLLSTRTAEQRVEREAERLSRRADFVARSLDQFLDKHRLAVTGAADAMVSSGDLSPAAATRWLSVFHALYAAFSSMLVADADGALVAVTVNGSGTPEALALAGENVSDREYFQRAMAGGTAFVSDAFRGRGIGEAVIVAISAPLAGTPGGRPRGIVEGSLDLGAIGRLITDEALTPAIDMLVVDNRGRVVFSSVENGYALLDPVTATDWSGADGARGRDFLTASTATEGNWRVLLRVSIAQINAARWEEFRVASAWLGLVLVAALLLAWALSAGIARPLAWLDGTVRALDLQRPVPPPPRSAPGEIKRIALHLEEVTERLRRSYTALEEAIDQGEALRRELADAVRNREALVRRRTMELEEANRALEALSLEDSLTGLANRRRLTAFLDRSWRACARNRRPLALLVLDVDHFKAFNDRYGHIEGDACLRQVAAVIRAGVSRPTDLASRYGGEEFVIVLGETSTEDALTVAGRLRDAVATLAIPHEDSRLRIVTVSIGIAAAIPTVGADPADLIGEADDALYAAKRAGRNRVCAATGVLALPAAARPPRPTASDDG